MKKLFIILASLTVLIPAIATPLTGFAQTICPSTGEPITGSKPCELTNNFSSGIDSVIGILDTITNWLFTFLLIFAVIMFLYSAYLYLFSGGSEEATAKAKNYILYAVIGIAVAMLAKGITFIVYQLIPS